MVAAWATSASTGVGGAGSAGVTVTKPTGLADGDVMYAFCSRTVFSPTTPFSCTGWTDISPATQGTTGANDRQLTILRKIVTDASGEPADYTFVVTGLATSIRKVGIVARITGADTVTPEDIAVPDYVVVGTTNTVTPPSADATTVTANALVLSFCQLSLDTVAARTWGPPSGYTHGDSNSFEAGTLNNQSGVAYKTQVSPGAVGTNAWTHSPSESTTDCLVAVVIVRPLSSLTGNVSHWTGSAWSATGAKQSWDGSIWN